MSILDENQAFEQWRSSTGNEKEKLLENLVKLLTKHGYAVCWQKIPDLQGEFSWIVNESVWRAVERSKNFRGGSRFSTWFHRIVLNECNRVLKKRQLRREMSTEELENDDCLRSDVSHVDIALDADTLKARLKPRDKRIWEMMIMGMSGEEIARELGISPRAVISQWWRIKRGLRDAG